MDKKVPHIFHTGEYGNAWEFYQTALLIFSRVQILTMGDSLSPPEKGKLN